MNKTRIIYSTFSKETIRFWPLFALLLVLVTGSCRKDENLGREIQPNEGNIFLHVTDSFTMKAATIQALPDRTDERILGLIGTYNDPVFGKNSATFFTQLDLTTKQVDFGDPNSIVIDSMVLALRLVGLYRKKGKDAEIRELVNLKVYELAEDLYLDSTYSSASIVKTKPKVIGSYNGPVSVVENIQIGEDLVPPHIRIQMDMEWAKKIMFAGEEVYRTNENFKEFLKGIKIEPADNGVVGEGAIFYFDPLSSVTGMSVFYHYKNNDSITQRYDYQINANSAYFAKYDHDYQNTVAGQAFNDTTIANEVLYLQSMFGVHVVLELHDLIQALGEEPKVINFAELIIPVDTTQEFAMPEQITLKRLLENGTTELLPDQLEIFPRDLDGKYNSEEKHYRFKITQYIEERLRLYDPQDPRTEVLIITPVGNDVSADRAVLNGLNPSDPNKKKIRLIVSYTPI